MKSTTADAIKLRYSWLRRVCSGEIKTSKEQSEGLENMRAFCELDISGEFSKISYNTLKQYSRLVLDGEVTGLFNVDGWEALKLARMEAWEKTKIDDSLSSVAGDIDENIKFLKLRLRESEVLSQLCAMAFMELHRKIRGVVSNENFSSGDLRHQIKLALEQSADKYESILSPNSGLLEVDGLKLVGGGKKM